MRFKFLATLVLTTSLFASVNAVADGSVPHAEPPSNDKRYGINGYAVITVGNETLNTFLNGGKAHSLKRLENNVRIGISIDTQCTPVTVSSTSFVCKFEVDETSIDIENSDVTVYRSETFLMTIPYRNQQTILNSNFGVKNVTIVVNNLLFNNSGVVYVD